MKFDMPGGKAMLTLWPPTNGRFGFKMSRHDAQLTRKRGWAVVDGKKATVVPDDGTNPELVQFQYDDWDYHVPT